MAVLNTENAVEQAMIAGVRDAIRAEITKKFLEEINALVYEAVREVSERLRFTLKNEYDPMTRRNEVRLVWTFSSEKGETE